MSAKRILINCVLSSLLVSIFILIHHEPAYSAQPGVDLYNNAAGVSTRTGPTSDPEDPYFTALCHSAKIIDYDGISFDGDSHDVRVTYPNGEIKPLNFYYTIDEHSAVYSLWDDTIDFWDESKTPSEPYPTAITDYTGDYVYHVVDPTGQSGEATDHLDVDLIEPPDDRTFSPGFGVEQTIEAYFDDVCAYDEDGIEIECDDFSEGFNPDNWQWKPPEVSYENEQACFEITWDNTSRNIRMKTHHPEWICKFKANVRVSSISGYAPTARIGGTYCQDEKGNILARVGIRKTNVGGQDEHEAYYTLYRSYDEGAHSIIENFVPPIRIDKVDLGKNYEISLQWEETTSTFTFGVIGLDDAVNKTATYTLTGIINPTNSPSRFIDTACWLTLDTTTPTFRWDPVDPVSNPHVTHYRVRIDSNGHTVYSGYEKSCELKCPPGVLKPNGDYKYRVYALDHHRGFEWENAGNSDMNKMNFTAGSIESQDPYVDLYHRGVSTWTRTPPVGTLTNFYIRIHDAQGVPENIESVKVFFPDRLTEMNLYLQENDSETCGRYRAHYFGPIQSGDYQFTVVDKDGNSHSKTEELTADTINPPFEDSLQPANNAVIGGTGYTFDWDDVPPPPEEPEAAFYELALYDEDLDYLFSFMTTASEYILPSGILEEETLYRYKIYTRREFYEDNEDNGSHVPAYTWDSNTFFTTADTNGTEAQPSIILDSFGVTVWQAPHPATGDPVCQLEFLAMVTDDDGVPENIEKVEVTYPDGTTTRLLKYVDNPDWGSNYQAVEYYTDPFSTETGIQTGIYTFRVVDFDGHEVELQDELTDVVSNILPWPTSVTPANDTVLNNTMPTISWDPVTGASYYKVRILEGWAGSTVHWSEELIQMQTSYTVQNGILKPDTTYGYRVYAYKVLNGNEVDFYSSNCLWHPVNNHFTTGAACECDLNNDGKCNILDWPYFIEDWGRTDCNEPAVDCECDLNGDGSCNILDWPYFIEDWGRTDCPL